MTGVAEPGLMRRRSEEAVASVRAGVARLLACAAIAAQAAFPGEAFADDAFARSTCFWILPVLVLGTSSKRTSRGHLKRARCARQCSISSCASACAPSGVDGTSSGLTSTKASGVSPHFGSGRATTAQASTAGCL